MSVFGIFLVRIFPYSDSVSLHIQSECEKIRNRKKLRIRTLFTQRMLGIIQTLRNAIIQMVGGRVANFVTNRYGYSGEGRGVSVMPLCNADKIFYIANFTRNLPIGNCYLYYLISKPWYSGENYSSNRLIL